MQITFSYVQMTITHTYAEFTLHDFKTRRIAVVFTLHDYLG